MTNHPTPPLDRADIDTASSALLALTEQIARELHAGRGAIAPANLDASLANELALDSLARVELGARIERQFAISLHESAVFDAETPRDLLRAIVKARTGAPLKMHAPLVVGAADTRIGEPLSAQTLQEMLRWHVQRHPERAHIQFYDDFSDGEILSYGDLHTGAVAVAANLQQRGLLPGESVALMLPTGRDYFFTFYGIVLAGGIPVPIYPPVRRQQLEDHVRRQRRILTNCQAVMLVTTGDALTVAHLLTAAVDSLRHILEAARLTASVTGFEEVHAAASDLALVQYTSGSTGDPKGVMLTHANLLANVRADGHGMGATSSDVFVSWLPLYHDMGLIGAWLGSLYHGVRLVVMSPLTFLNRPERWLWALHRFRGTLSAAPNFAYELCVKRVSESAIEGLDLSGWRIAANGAEAISVATLDAFCARFSRYGFRREAMFPVYGLAECSVGLAFTPLGRGPLVDRVKRAELAGRGVAVPADADADEKTTLRLVACGQPLPRHEIRIVDDANRELPERHEGRLQFRGPSATSGYFNRPDETAKLIKDGWLESGDRAYLAAGDVYLTGRTKDIVIRAGRNIYPTELEDAIGELEGIRSGHVAIFAAADEASASERVIVLAESRKRTDAAHAALRISINELATDLIGGPVDEVLLVPPNTVLRTSSGKIRRAACRALYEQGRLGHNESAMWQQVAHLLVSGVVPQLRRLGRRAKNWMFAMWAWASFSCLGLLAWSLTWLPLTSTSLWRGERLLARASAACTATRISLKGAEHLPSAGSACVVVANHQSYLDGVLLLAVLNRRPRFLVKAELEDSRILARALTRIGAVFVQRFAGSGALTVMDDAARLLQESEMLAIFPEGTFKRMPGILPFHLGSFATAAAANAAVIPIAIRGTRSILRSGSWFPRHASIEIVIGAPIVPNNSSDQWAQALLLRDNARAHILEFCGEPDLAHESNEVDLPG